MRVQTGWMCSACGVSSLRWCIGWRGTRGMASVRRSLARTRARAARKGVRIAGMASRVSAWPEQVLRYCHHADAQPLWLSRLRRPAEVPPCGRCGAPRWFEYQIVPNLVASIERAAEAGGAGHAAAPEEALDWGTLAVFTCSASCAATGEADAYAEEYCWHQTA